MSMFTSTQIPRVPQLPRFPRVSRRLLRQAALVLLLGGLASLAGRADAATLTVNSTDDIVDVNGCDVTHCSLREAVEAANAAPGADSIAFGIPGAGPHVIVLGLDFPDLEGDLTIDGYSQPGASANTRINGALDTAIRIELRGDFCVRHVLRIDGPRVTLQGLAISNASRGIIVSPAASADVVIKGNYVGIGAAGTAAFPMTHGIEVQEGAGVTIGGNTPADTNVIGGASVNGIAFLRNGPQPVHLTILRNYIGVAPDDATPVGNAHAGIAIEHDMQPLSPDDVIVIGGMAGANTIGGNGMGIYVHATQSMPDEATLDIGANTIGAEWTRTTPIPNTGAGLVFDGPVHAHVQANGIVYNGGSGVIVRGPLTDGRLGVLLRNNVIVGNAGLGIDLNDDGRTSNDADDSDTGANDLLNYPVLLDARQDPASKLVRLAGTIKTAPHQTYRVELFSNGVSVSPPGTDAYGTVHEVLVFANAQGDGSFLSYATLPMVQPGDTLVATLTSLNGLYTSEISDPIIVGTSGPSIRAKVTRAVSNANMRHVRLSMTGTANGSAVTDDSGVGVLFDVAPGDYTITPEAVGYTFSPSSITLSNVTTRQDIAFVATPDAGPMTFTVNSTADFGDGACTVDECTLREAIAAANAHAGQDSVAFAIPGAGPHEIAISTELPTLEGDLTIDGYTQPGARANTLPTGGLDTVLKIALRPAALPVKPGLGLEVRSSGQMTIRGLSIDGFVYDVIVWDNSAPGLDLRIEGNFIGTTIDGLDAGLTGGYRGIQVGAQRSSRVAIGGPTPAARNLISNQGSAIETRSPTFPQQLDLTIQGNLLGPDSTGYQTIGNSYGIQHHLGGASADRIRIGGDAPGEGNIIAASIVGIDFDRYAAADLPDADHLIAGNYVGLAEDAETTFNAMGTGIRFCGAVRATARGNAIGNTIRGIATCNNTMQVTFSSNRFRFITNHAIDLGTNGATPNDADDSDTGPNDLQNFPVVTTVDERIDGARIAGTLTSVPLQAYRVELFATGGSGVAARDAKQVLGHVDVTTDAQGLATFDTTVVTPAPLALDERIVATATNTGMGVTSELSDPTAMAPLSRYAITGRLTLNDVPLANVAVQVSGSRVMSAQSDAAGAFTISGVPATGTYTVTPSDARYRVISLAATFPSLAKNEVADFAAVLALTTRYFAEGAAGSFWDMRIAILNPLPSATTAEVTFLLSDGRSEQVTVPIAGPGHAVVDPATIPALNGATFSTRVQSVEPIVATRTMRWGTQRELGAHAEQAVSEPRTDWYFAEGATGCFDLFYQLANPNATAADVEVTFVRRAPEMPVVRTYTVGPFSRSTIHANGEAGLAFAEVSARMHVTNGQPIVAERAMYANCPSATGQITTWRGGHDAVGSGSAATVWRFAEGATGSFFDLYLLLANFEAQAANVEIEYLLTDGSRIIKPYEVPAGSRLTIDVAGEAPQLANAAVSAVVTSLDGVPIVAERAQWWPRGDWYEGHASTGVVDAGIEWHAAGAEVGGPHEVNTYLLIANAGSTSGLAQVTAIFADGTTHTLPQPIALKARSRTTLDLAAVLPQAKDQVFGLIVTSLATPSAPTPAPIVVELSTYNDTKEKDGTRFWGAGTNIVATRIR